MHATNKSTLNGKMTRQQQEQIRLKIWRWLIGIYIRKKKKDGNISKKGIQISYGLVSRKFNISYNQVRYIFDYFCYKKYLKKWIFRNEEPGNFKNKGNFYSLEWKK